MFIFKSTLFFFFEFSNSVKLKSLCFLVKIFSFYLFLPHSSNSEVNLDMGFMPPNEFTDSREFSEAECDRERALDLEVQRVMENSFEKAEREELTSLLAR